MSTGVQFVAIFLEMIGGTKFDKASTIRLRIGQVEEMNVQSEASKVKL